MPSSFNHFGQVAEAFKPAISQVVRKTALEWVAQAASSAPVDTGFLKNSIYSVTSDGSGYQGGDKALPEIAGPADDQSAFVAVGAEYGVYVEFGTSRAPAQPYFYPAMEKVRPGFESAIAAIQNKLAEAAK